MPDFSQLTERQKEIYHFIRQKIENRGYGPTVREIGLGFGIRRLGEPEVHLHESDALARGIAAGDDVRVHNDRGSFVARAAISAQTRPGVAFSYKQQWHKRSPDGINVNATTPERDSDLGEGPTFHDNRVEVERISA